MFAGKPTAGDKRPQRDTSQCESRCVVAQGDPVERLIGYVEFWRRFTASPISTVRGPTPGAMSGRFRTPESRPTRRAIANGSRRRAPRSSWWRNFSSSIARKGKHHDERNINCTYPRITDGDVTRVIGLAERYTEANMERIPEQWERFQKRLGDAEGRTDPAQFGLCYAISQSPLEFDYLRGVMVDEDAPLPSGFIEQRVQPRRAGMLSSPIAAMCPGFDRSSMRSSANGCPDPVTKPLAILSSLKSTARTSIRSASRASSRFACRSRIKEGDAKN